MDNVNAILPNLQIGPLWLIAIGVGIGIFLASKFPIVTKFLPNFAKPTVSQEEIENNVANKVYDRLAELLKPLLPKQP